MVTGLRLDNFPISANAGQRLPALRSWFYLSAPLPASTLAAKIPALISFPAPGHVLGELSLLIQHTVNEHRKWPPAESKGKGQSVC